MATPIIPTFYFTIPQYAEHHGLSERTVKRYLAAGELPGAMKNEHNQWQIPAHVERTLPQQHQVALVQPSEIEPAHHSLEFDDAPRRRTFYTADEAAELMSSPEMKITGYAVRKHREYFHAVDAGPNGQIIVPAARIRELKGMR